MPGELASLIPLPAQTHWWWPVVWTAFWQRLCWDAGWLAWDAGGACILQFKCYAGYCRIHTDFHHSSKWGSGNCWLKNTSLELFHGFQNNKCVFVSVTFIPRALKVRNHGTRSGTDPTLPRDVVSGLHSFPVHFSRNTWGSLLSGSNNSYNSSCNCSNCCSNSS